MGQLDLEPLPSGDCHPQWDREEVRVEARLPSEGTSWDGCGSNPAALFMFAPQRITPGV